MINFIRKSNITKYKYSITVILVLNMKNEKKAIVVQLRNNSTRLKGKMINQSAYKKLNEEDSLFKKLVKLQATK